MHQIDILVHVGASIILIGYAIRDQIVLRLMVVIGTLFYVAYYLSMDTPLWSSLMWNALFISINIFMVIKLYRDRIVGKMSYMNKLCLGFYITLIRVNLEKLGMRDILKRSIASLAYVTKAKIIITFILYWTELQRYCFQIRTSYWAQERLLEK